jgi:hypothetical protein
VNLHVWRTCIDLLNTRRKELYIYIYIFFKKKKRVWYVLLLQIKIPRQIQLAIILFCLSFVLPYLTIIYLFDYIISNRYKKMLSMLGEYVDVFMAVREYLLVSLFIVIFFWSQSHNRKLEVLKEALKNGNLKLKVTSFYWNKLRIDITY